jgi:hypothetical protein
MAKFTNAKFSSKTKFSFMKKLWKLKSELIQRKSATIWSRIVCPHLLYPKPQRLKYTEIKFCLLFCMDVRLGLTLREEHRLKVFENMLLRRIFGPQMGRGNRGMEKTTYCGALRKALLFFSPDIFITTGSGSIIWGGGGGGGGLKNTLRQEKWL